LCHLIIPLVFAYTARGPDMESQWVCGILWFGALNSPPDKFDDVC